MCRCTRDEVGKITCTAKISLQRYMSTDLHLYTMQKINETNQFTAVVMRNHFLAQSTQGSKK